MKPPPNLSEATSAEILGKDEYRSGVYDLYMSTGTESLTTEISACRFAEPMM
ncbi:hypothetical protein HB825_13755 [Listeria booriae]|uniref:hypothetical protein n=1 Tax=Listeria booriae TaxID=1552123 RepID=UPI001627B7BA|nr:hypothetical protein [Listeria booriae]MBC1529587.1 hypothetical protein [Listeria booriae]MBC1800435.1 hypothetical protein [Listeria booriae]MBC1802992.1 hypothetical protein [Listeria booriae]MBC2159698.1 hypothetical protein [Listeria booriae]MBC6135904.1 hypothetical protein [Listeria booriae]